MPKTIRAQSFRYEFELNEKESFPIQIKLSLSGVFIEVSRI